jgi:hypothetical protein
MYAVSQPLWPFNNCRLADQAQCGSLALSVIPRNHLSEYEMARSFCGMPQRIMSPEDLAELLRGTEPMPPELTKWVTLEVTMTPGEQIAAVGGIFRERLTQALAEHLAAMPPTDADRLAAYYASRQDISKLITRNVEGCSYTYRGTPVWLAMNDHANWILDEMCRDVQFYGPLLDTFTHAAPDNSSMLSGGMAGPGDVRQFMPLCNVASAGMLLYLYIVGLPASDESDAFSKLAAALFNTCKQRIDAIMGTNDYGMMDEDDQARLFDANMENMVDLSHRQLAAKCVQTLLLKPHAAVAAGYSHEMHPSVPRFHARKLLSMSTMTANPLRSSDFTALVTGKKRNERQGLMVPNVIYA